MSQNQVEHAGHVLRCSGYALVKTDVVRAQGCYLFDIHGKRYIDFEAGVWCTALGHNHWRVNQAIRTQLDTISHVGYRYTQDLVEEAAATVLRTLALVEGRCIFLSSGSEAVEFGVQIARRLSGRPLLLTMSDSYLAAYGSAGRRNPEDWFCFDWGVCTTCPEAEGCDPQCAHLSKIPFELVGGMVFEPGNASGLVRFPPKQLVQTLVAKIKAQRGLLVIDEVTTGMGRTGAWYGFQHYGLEPDVVAVGKGLGNGFPVSAVAVTGDLVRRLELDAFRYAQSHQNDPLGCAVARTVVTAIQEEGLIERSCTVGARFLRELGQLAQRRDALKEVRGRGLLTVLEFSGHDGQLPVTEAFGALIDRGFFVGCKPAANILRFYPPLTIGEDDITELLANLEDILVAAE